MTYLFTFLEGIASFISPCILPLLPLYISYFAGGESKKTKTITNSIAFVLGFSIIFVVLAIIANIVGNTFMNIIKYVKIIFGIVIIFLGLNYIGIFNFNLFGNFKKFNADVKELNFIKSFIFGIFFAISLTPCIGTFLSSALLLIATEENIIMGIILMILYCIGLGLPFIISSVLIDKLRNAFSFIKNNYKIIKIISGAILIIMGIYLIFF